MSDRDQDQEIYQAAVAAIDPDAEFVAARELTGGVSAHVALLEYRTAEGEERQCVFRQHRSDLFKEKRAGLTAMEYAVHRVLHAAGLPVPEPLALVENRGVTAPFLVTEFFEGSTSVADGAVDHALAAMAGFLARLHRFDPRPLAGVLPVLEDPIQALPGYLARDERGAAIRHVLADCEPTPLARPVIVHGDYWPGNVIWVDGQLEVVVDWEDAAIGDPLADLATARVELCCLYGAEAMDRFTTSYVDEMGPSETHEGADPPLLRMELLPIWEVYVSITALASMHLWGLPPADEARRRVTTGAFFERAADDLLAQP